MTHTYRRYLGDSVYVEYEGWDRLKLYTDNGYGPTNEIYLEYGVYRSLVDFVESLEEHRNDQ